MNAPLSRVMLFVFSFLSATGLLGQNNAPTMMRAPDPDSGITGHVDGLFIPLVTGQPFHAKITVDLTRQLPDGTMVAQKYFTQVARDSNGREYRENRDLVPAGSDREPPLLHTIVYDPKTSLITNCTPDRRVCRQVSFDPTAHPVDEAVGPSSDGKSVLTRENLGTKTMSGLEVVGTRETRTIQPGAFGNDKPVVVIKEFWYSPQLQFNLSVTRIDPRNGTQKLEVADLKLGEPGPEWFAIPDGYRLVQERSVNNRMTGPAELAPLLEKNLPGMTSDQLAVALQPVEAALGAYAKAHAEASPNDRNDVFAGQIRMRLSSELQMMQQNRAPQAMQFNDADLRLNQIFREVVESPCLKQPAPGDPPSMPSNEQTLRAEERTWVALRDAWSAFLAKLFPNSDKAGFAWMLTNERTSELRRIQNVERNRGCIPEESIAQRLEGAVPGQTPEQLSIALKPVDTAIFAYVKAHAEASPRDRNENFLRQVQQRLSADLRIQEQSGTPSQEQFEEADLHLNQAYRLVIASPCLNKTIPADPPNAPISEEKLRAEQRAWVTMRDAWAAFLSTLFPNAKHPGFASTITEERANEIRQIQNVERNRGCSFAEQ